MALYLVGTPIGNLEDISMRALRTLREVALIAAEDTRTTGRLLQHFEIDTPLTSYHEHTKQGKIAELVRKLESMDMALVSDAGMPGLSDPGYRLVRAAIDAGIPITPIPGPSAAVTALVSSGLPTDSFLFLGFLPRQQTARRKALDAVKLLPYTLVLYESPHRLADLLADVAQTLSEREVCVGRELTKMYEELWRGSASAAQTYFASAKVRGEVTVVVSGAAETVSWDEAMVRQALAEHIESGSSRKDATAAVTKMSGWRKRAVYKIAMSI